jgi:hypothetical protein
MKLLKTKRVICVDSMAPFHKQLSKRTDKHREGRQPDKLGLYSETGFHIGMERNFVCLWRRPNCRSQVIDLYLSALIF